MNSLTKIIITSVCAFIGAMALVLFLAKPILAQIGSLHIQEGKQQSQLAQLNSQLDAYDQAKTELKQANYQDTLDAAVLAREDLAEVLTEVEADAAKTSVTETITIDDAATANTGAKIAPIVPGEKNLTEVPYTLRFNATFGDTVTFLQYLEHLSHFTEVSGLDFAAISEPTDNPDVIPHADNISGTISGVFFVKKETVTSK
ncbi:MAG TPA: hypothetical protein VFX17_03435 [Patescibacteria group bacterium]|nr:hypothetical protein [Patescibacteria group bacterium]